MYVATFLTVLVALICFVRCEANCLKNLPVPEHGRIKVIRFTASGIAVEYECLQFYIVEGESTVECAHGEWAESPPTCKDSRCYLRNLPEKDGVDLTDDRRVYYSNEKAEITCASGYDLKYPEVRCEQGEWQTQNKLSPCQGNSCLVNPIDNGAILEQKSKPVRNIWGTEIGMETFYESALMGSSKPSGTVLYVICINRYLFQGKETEGLTEIVCRREEWTPIPICLLPNRDLGVELQKVDEETTTLSPVIDSNLIIQTHTMKGDKKATGTMDADRRPNDAVEETVSVDISEEHGFGEEGLETIITVNTPCSCRYGVQDDVLVAFDGKTVLKFNDEVYSCTTVIFYCQDPELYILRGPETLHCPKDCSWHPSMFPSCVYSKTSRDLRVEQKVGDEETPTVSPFVHSILETHMLNSNSSRKTVKVDRTANGTAGENDFADISRQDWFSEGFEFSDKSTAGSGETLETSAVVNPPCTCKYGVQNDVLVAFDGKTVLKYNDEVYSGLTVMFYCQEPGFYHFRGPEMLKCPDDCSWDPDMFPSCVYPEDYDIFIKVSTDPIKNMKVGIGGVITVIPGTKLELGCSISSLRRRRRLLRWVTTADDNGFMQEEFVNRTQIYRSLYTLPVASYGDSGNYTCYSYRRGSRSVTIDVRGLECPEINETEGMTISYTQNRTLNSTATFHCFSPYKRNGPSYVTCEEPGMWSGPLPSCNYDVISIKVSTDPIKNMKVGVGGVITVIPGTRLQLSCSTSSLNRRRRQLRLVTTADGNGVKQEEFDDRTKSYRLLYTLPAASYDDSGNYTCYSYRRRSRSVTIEVRGLECPEINETEEMTISYTQNRAFNSTATFHCFSPYKRDGPSYVTCEASGMWSGPLPSCHLPCSVVALFGVIPEEVVPNLDDSVTENVSHGYTVKLGCDRVGWILKGDDNATCSTGGKWKAEPGVHCAPGCTRLQKKTGSELVISPDKEFYSLGESITVSCPDGKDLTDKFERIMCISNGWMPGIIPDCH